MADVADRWVVVLAGFTSGVGAASVNIAARYTNDPGDVLGFFGGAFGAGLAVLGALGVERYKEWQTNRTSLTYLAQALVALGAQTMVAKRQKSGPTWSGIVTVMQGMTAVRMAHSSVALNNALLNAKIAPMLYWFNRWEASLANLAEQMNLQPEAARIMADQIFTRIARLLKWVLGSPDNWPQPARGAVAGFLLDVAQSLPPEPDDGEPDVG